MLDNFETNLKPQTDAATAAASCQDPAWDACLAALAKELVGYPSRVLITSRRPLTALADGAGYPVLLGPLPASEAALYLRAHPALSKMVFGGHAGEKALALRLLNASRFHPLLMDRLARLAAKEELRPQLLEALDTLEKTKDFAQLPALFATKPGDAKELAYLGDALATSLDQLIREASPDARRVLWMISVANEPVTLDLLESVWSGEDHQQQQLRQIKRMLDILPRLPPELQEKFKAMPPEFRALLDALPPEAPARPELAPLLRQLLSVGLATEERTGPEDANPDISCHELVRERIRAWMAQQPQDRGEFTENAIRLAYAERLAATFQARQHQNMTAALQAGSRAVVYCVQAEAWDRLGSFASRLVTSTGDPCLLEGLIPHLQTAAESAPDGQQRWKCLCYLADALRMGGRPDVSLPFFEQAATQARAAASGTAFQTVSPDPVPHGLEARATTQQAWADLAAITGNWANALYLTGNPEAARQRHLDSAEAEKQAGCPAVNVMASELEALRIDILQGRVDAALPQVEARLARVEQWWQAHRSGQPVPEAPDAEFLARVFIGALDIAKNADFAREDWASALRRLNAVLEVKRALERPAENIGGTRMNRANVLKNLGRFNEARAELEACLPLFQNKPDLSQKVFSSLADLFSRQGDVAQAITQERRALALCEQLPDPADRAMSHGNLTTYLERQGIPSALAEARRHDLATLIYFLVSGMGQHLQTWVNNYAIRFRSAHAAGTELAVPRVDQLLADPAFAPLDQWLRKRQVPLDKLQSDVDQFLAQARQAALAQK